MTAIRVKITIAMLLLGGGLSTAQPVDAEKVAQAADLFDQGRADVQAGQYSTACPKFEESLRLDPQIGTKLNLANCYEQIGHVASAWAIYTEVVETAKAESDREFATKAVARLKPRVPHILIQASTLPGLTVSLDGTAVTVGLARALDPGPHKLEFGAKDRISKAENVEAIEGKTISVEVPALEAQPTVTPPDSAPEERPVVPPPAPVTEPLESGLTLKRKLALISAGGAVVALGVGTWAAVSARSLRDSARSQGCTDDLSSCPSAALSDANDAYSRGQLATGFVIAGGALVITGAILWFTGARADSPSTTAVRIRPTLDPHQAAIGITGAF